MRIKRWKCRECGGTCSCLPNFLLAHRQYLVQAIQGPLSERFEAQHSWEQIQANCTESGLPALRTLQRWCCSWREQASGWLGPIQEALARQDSRSPWLDPQGETLKATGLENALFRAATYLLAWAKTQWAELVDYGWNDRLRFLWVWGAGRGLGRLV